MRNTQLLSFETESLAPYSPRVELSPLWEVIGPFPTGMREHPLTSSPLASFPFDARLDPGSDFAQRPYDSLERFPSALAKGGQVGWKRFKAGSDGWLEVRYEEEQVGWEQLRRDQGWSGLQYEVTMRTKLIVPELRRLDDERLGEVDNVTSILIELVQGVEFALIADKAVVDQNEKLESPSPTTWYNGDIYNYASSPSGSSASRSRRNTSNLTRPLSVRPGRYTLVVKAIYEIRMFGDPGIGSPPVIRLKVGVELDTCGDLGEGDEEGGMEIVDGLGIRPDLMDGWFMGGWASVPVRCRHGTKREALVIGVLGDMKEFLEIRPIAIRLHQTRPIPADETYLTIAVLIRAGDDFEKVIWKMTLRHRLSSATSPFLITFASPCSSPSSGLPALISFATVVPPPQTVVPSAPEHRHQQETSKEKVPVILALHGAGVDARDSSWAKAIPSRPGMWAVLPTGRTEWGEDWHGGSMADAWAARAALPGVLARLGVAVSEQTLLMGHSNGGQGVWHLAARYPDRVVGVIAASGWLTIQDYVPYRLTSDHFADPALMGILKASLTPYDNDLHASNLAHIPILAIHGSDDDNVPPWHGRQHVGLVEIWQRDKSSSNIRFVEVPKQGHWWEDVLKLKEVYSFLDTLPAKASSEDDRKRGFTLACANPQECGGRAGIRILELMVPGRLARLDVNMPQWRDEPDGGNGGVFHGMNIKRFSVVVGGGNAIGLDPEPATFVRTARGFVRQDAQVGSSPPRACGPMIRILDTQAPMIIVRDPAHHRLCSVAARIAYDLYLYYRIDSEIITPEEAFDRVAVEKGGLEGNVVVLGRPDENAFTEWMVTQQAIPLRFPEAKVFKLGGRIVWEKGTGIITLHPHPVSPTALAVLIAGNDDEGLELAARLFPLRTGVPIPDWALVSPRCRWQGAGGLVGAGFWDGEWQFSDCMSWMDR